MQNLLRKILKEHPRRELSAEGLTPAAVLVPIFEKEGEPHLLMSRRTDRVLKHKRQISFPGGVCDPQDRDVVSTALREAFEEVGLAPQDVEVLGLLGDIETMTGFMVTPVAGGIPYPYSFRINPVEVEGLLPVPWGVFSERRDYRREQVQYRGRTFEVDYYNYQDNIIWGATARITRQLVELVEGYGRAD